MSSDRVVDGRLRHPPSLAPARSALQEDWSQFRAGAVELGTQDVAKQRVVPVPPRAAMEGHQEQVRSREPFEPGRRSVLVQH